jgi:hypothetical protein
MFRIRPSLNGVPDPAIYHIVAADPVLGFAISPHFLFPFLKFISFLFVFSF